MSAYERLRAGLALLILRADQATALSLSTDINGNKFEHKVSTAELRALLDIEAKAEAWDEGYARGVRDEAGDIERADNPYDIDFDYARIQRAGEAFGDWLQEFANDRGVEATPAFLGALEAAKLGPRRRS